MKIPLAQANADTLVYYMGRKDCAMIAKQLIDSNTQHHSQTPVRILEAVSTQHERHWLGTLGQLACDQAKDWFKTTSPALIMIGEALREKSILPTEELEGPSSKIDNSLQDGFIFANSRRRA